MKGEGRKGMRKWELIEKSKDKKHFRSPFLRFSPEQIFHRKEIYEMIDHNNRREKIVLTINVVTSIGRAHWSSCTRRAKHRYFGLI